MKFSNGDSLSFCLLARLQIGYFGVPARRAAESERNRILAQEFVSGRRVCGSRSDGAVQRVGAMFLLTSIVAVVYS
jgi:hypothetical protein